MKNFKQYNLNLEYIHPSQYFEDYKQISSNLSYVFKSFNLWIERHFDSEVSMYIYGGGISGVIAYSFLRRMKNISVMGVIDRNLPHPYLKHLNHIVPGQLREKADLTIICTCPSHYGEINQFLKQLWHQPVVVFMFGEELSFISNKPGNESEKRGKEQQLYTDTGSDITSAVLMGDSLTNGLYKNLVSSGNFLINKGMGGAKIYDLLSETDRILETPPRAVFLMAGINDILQSTPFQDIFELYIILLNKIIDKKVTLYVQSTLPVSQSYRSLIDPMKINRDVNQLNRRLKSAFSSRAVFVDLTRILSPQGYLPRDVTSDGIHLNEKGYDIWTNAILPLL